MGVKARVLGVPASLGLSMPRPLFTPASAREALRELRPAAERMYRLFHELERRRPQRVVPEQPVERSYFRLVFNLNAELAAIYRGGARVGDLRRGLLDFPAQRGGRRVLLCWRVGEPTLEFWHEVEEGYAARRRVDENGPWES